MEKYKTSDHLKFIILSAIGIFLFMIPIPSEEGFTISIAILSGWLQDLLTSQLSLIMMIVIVLTAVFTTIGSVTHGAAYKRSTFFTNLFYTNLFWTLTRIVAAVFAVMVYFGIGPEAVHGPDTGQMLLEDLLHTLFTVFLFAGFFLPLLTNFGLLEFFGSLMTNIMRPLFKLPGRSSIDALASWVGDGTIGVLLTSKQYEDGFYTKREAAVIGTTFSVVSITFSLVVLAEVGLAHMFVPFYLTIIVAGLVAALIMPRIPPLSRKEDTFSDGSKQTTTKESTNGDGIIKHGYKQALDRAKQQNNPVQFFKEGGQNVLDMLMGVAPIVMAFGLIALMIAEYTPIFQWLGAPFIPLLELMQIPNAAEASETILIGFADMFLPSILAAPIEAEITRFIIAALSVTQLIYLSEVGGVLLGSKVPVGIKDLLIIFLLRTLITLPIITLFAHIIF